MGDFFNPDAGKEVGLGLLYSFLSYLGAFLNIAGIVIAIRNKLIGDLIFIIGALLMGISIYFNVTAKHGKIFAVLNIIVKAGMLMIFTIILFMVNLS